MRIEDERTLAGLALAIGVVAALLSPDLGRVFAPYLHQSLFFVVVFSLLPFARQDLSSLYNLSPAVAGLILWQQFLLPALAIVVGRTVGMDDQSLFLIVVVVTSGSLFASPTLIQIMNLDQKLAMQSVVLSTFAAPVSIFLSFMFVFESQSPINMEEFGNRILLYLVAPVCLLAVVRKLTGNLSAPREQLLERIARWGAIASLLVFCFALEEQVAHAVLTDPGKVLNFLIIAVMIALASAILTRVTMAHFGALTATTSSVLASFRNVGLTYGLVESSATQDLAIFVGVCQIPMFFTPLAFDLLLGNSRIRLRKPLEANSSNPENAGRILFPQRLKVLRKTSIHSGSVYQCSDNSKRIEDIPGHFNRNFPGYAVSNHARTMRRSNMATSRTNIATAVKIDELPLSQEDDRASAALERLREQRDEAQRDIQRIQSEIADEGSARNYLIATFLLVLVGMVAIWQANKFFSPMLFDNALIERVAETHIGGANYAVHDLNINIRGLRDATIARMSEAPETVVLGASQWQEAHVDLLPGKNFYNSHVHRDYYEDMLAVTGMYVRHDKLPREMIITIRDNLFTPVKDRTDFLWLSGMPYYRDMAARLGIEAHGWWETLPVSTWRELASLPLLWSQAIRDLTAPVKPQPTDQTHTETLDVLLPGGSITWSGEHKRLFSQERARHEALSFAAAKRNDPPRIDPKGVEHLTALLTFLQANNVKVTLAHPQFNPLFWDAVQGSAYMDGLKDVQEVTRNLADKFGLSIIGGFAPQSVGCTADMYIDAEHANSKCLGMLLSQFARLDAQPAIRGTLSW